MPEHGSLLGETVIFTGTLKTLEVFDLVRHYGGVPVSIPLIQVNEVEEQTDETKMKNCANFDWLIFTSQNAVRAFQSKMERFAISVNEIPSKIAAVGTRTAAALEKIGFSVEFIPSVFSADVFVKQFKPTNGELNVLFLKGTLAGSIIREELPFEVKEWTVYETGAKRDSIDSLVDLLKNKRNCSVLFASPSAVRVFKEDAVPIIGWEGYTIGAIGHITERALIEAGATVDVKPEIYTLKELVKSLSKRKDEFR
ncbi:uroporphyrinogen-III synthase [Sporosarcina thermotolerans]|uniref:Uroporphyrinogen-III synthase n=1 Tax=Sporosarcina thermotolerans TaxID=633404 RepID=A0AAW9AC18_9BACL|nr:uroporphyrinogen-III synthase [Sporosarcina thermotolerans]MDW0118118.1 uroporphyrinogen-III synthase [Sporosarcina thermotolerans]WHT47612.1 uroporphyrinogen-III synthase [Sporosarcina thermotolerans]